MKTIYLDTETTGLKPYKHDIHQLACLIQIDKEVVEEHDLRIRPRRPENIEPRALQIAGVTKEQIMAYPESKEVYKTFLTILGRHIDKYDTSDKFTIIGYNVRFDVDFIRSWFQAMDDPYFGSWFHSAVGDVMALAAFARQQGFVKPADSKLGTLCRSYDIELDAHDALNDIRATRSLAHKLLADLRGCDCSGAVKKI